METNCHGLGLSQLQRFEPEISDLIAGGFLEAEATQDGQYRFNLTAAGRAAVTPMIARQLRPEAKSGLASCRVCHCTEHQPCNPPCSWSEPDLCSSCDAAAIEVAALLTDWADEAHEPRITELLREALMLLDSELILGESDRVMP